VAGRIILLTEETINKIAAGEVVERPASVVKELVENSLDAGAANVTVEVEEGGRKRIAVTDDGCGMSEEDALLCLHRHATSKIQDAEDLYRITTLGFRGEALPSIAAVGTLRLRTQEPEAEEGVEILVEGGEVKDFRHVGCPIGTQVEVAGLFANTPARLKFLKSAATELTHIYETVAMMALAHHRLSFRLLHNGQESLFLPGTEDLRNSLAVIYGWENAENLLPVKGELGSLSLSGYVSSSSLTRSSRARQAFFVNGRMVRSKSLAHALAEAYRGLIPPDRHPIACLMLELDPALYDPNVHPTKTEVRFSREWEVHDFALKALQEALQATPIVAAFRPAPPAPVTEGARPPGFFGTPLRRSIPASRRRPNAQTPIAPPETAPLLLPEASSPQSLARAAILGQLDNTYIVCNLDEGLLIVDQHAAHERVVFERLKGILNQGGAPDSEGLVVALPLRLTGQEALLLKDCREQINALGFQVEEFGPNSFAVRSVPAFLAKTDVNRLISDVLTDLLAERSPASVKRQTEILLRSIACHSAVRAGQNLSQGEMRAILEGLSQVSDATTCPHGRPTFLTVSPRRLAHMFRRGRER
jgi:DNA mismatch repair protein MutL